MKAPYRYSLSVSLFTGAFCAFALPAAASEPTVESLIHPESRVEVGIAVVGDESHLSGMYNGMGGGGVYPIFDATIFQRDDKTGTWLRFFGESLGTEGGQLRFEHEQQGAWNYFLETERTTYNNPRVINSAMSGIGTTTTIAGAPRRELDLEMNRDKVKAGGGMNLKDGFRVDFSAREERKTGNRQTGVRGFYFVAEPIEFLTHEYNGNLSYTGKQFQMQAGYLGSIFSNGPQNVTIPASTWRTLSLPPDNMMHQIYMNGGYSFTPTTRGTFNASYSRMTQDNEFFVPPNFAGNTRTDLGGKVDNYLANLALTSRPIKDLSTRVKLRYEERNDNTPLAQYVAASTTRSGFNVPFSRNTTTGDAEATYQLPMRFKLIGGVGYEHWERSAPPIRQTAFRHLTEEVSARVSLRRPLLETLSGSVGYVHSERFGTGHLPDGTNLIDPILWGNRSRDKGRATLDWAPTNVFSLQFIGEASQDIYGGRDLGPQKGSSYFSSLDANYKFADDWDLTGWVSWNTTQMEQRTRSSTTTPWEARLRHIGKAAGATVTGKATDQIKLVADLQRSEDTSVHGISTLSTGIGPSLPDIEYRQWLLSLTGDYALQENNGIKLKYGFAHVTARDWTWKGFVYADGTQVKIPDSEQTHFIGLSYYHRW